VKAGAWPPPCRFAPLYTMGALMHDENSRRSFIDSAIYHEGHFHEIGYNHNSGLPNLAFPFISIIYVLPSSSPFSSCPLS